MPRKKSAHDDQPEVASWFFTYSDVITLLMTFFILLLTFSTTEPEKFEQMQYALFGGDGSMGIVGTSDSNKPKDSFLIRERPPSARITTRGSQTPPIYSDTSRNSLSKGLEGLDEVDQTALDENHIFTVPIGLFLTRDSEVTGLGRQQLRMFSKQLHRGPYDVAFVVSADQEVSRALSLARDFIDRHGISPGRVAVGQETTSGKRGQLSIILTRQVGQ